MMTRWGWRVLLAVVMLWMQQASLRHDLEHALEDPHQAAHVLCQECLGGFKSEVQHPGFQ